MKQLKDYLHLYLGCRLYHPPDETGRTYNLRLEAVSFDTNQLLISGNTYWKNISLFKPVLRTLSGMTEEEFSEFKILCEDDFSKMVVIESVSKKGDYTRLCHQAKSQAYLLSKHFDLFNLIEAGLAIDKTTLQLQGKNLKL